MGALEFGQVLLMVEGAYNGQELEIVILDEDMTDHISYFSKNSTDNSFWQGSDPKHTCKKAKEGHINHQIKHMPWPAWSPDLH